MGMLLIERDIMLGRRVSWHESGGETRDTQDILVY